LPCDAWLTPSEKVSRASLPYDGRWCQPRVLHHHGDRERQDDPPSAAGILLAVPVAWLLRAALLNVRPFDPLVFGSVLGVLLLAGWLGCLMPALRATRVDPQIALGEE
jgi:hypothetical protein